MATGIDHVVIAVHDLDQAIADYTAAGFTVIPGGDHASGETHNALVAFTDGSYFELIAWKAEPAQPTVWWQRLQAGEGFVDWALRTADLDADVERLRAAGLEVPDPSVGGRTRPDGQRADWLTLRLDPARYPSLPFWCHSTNDRTLRVPTGQAAVHENGVTGIHKIFVGVSDLDQAAADYHIVSGIDFDTHARDQPEENRWHQFRVGTFNIVLIEPEDPASELAQAIATRGQVPVEVALKSTNAQGSAIDHALTHGAKLAILEAEAAVETPAWEPAEGEA